jgi:hypothetical protein
MRELEMTMAEPALKYPTDPAAFLDWEQRQTERYELVGGVVRMMVGAARSAQHGGRQHPRGIGQPSSRQAVSGVARRHPGRSARRPAHVPGRVGELHAPPPGRAGRGRSGADRRGAVAIDGALRPDGQALGLSGDRGSAADRLRGPRRGQGGDVTREVDGSWRSVFATESGGELPLSCLELDLPMAEIYADIAFDRIAAEAG